MKAWRARIAYAAMITPSIRKCGVVNISGMSLRVPGSDSSALTTRYFGLAPAPVASARNEGPFGPGGNLRHLGRAGRNP